MSLADYSSLKTSVSNWLHRADLAAVVPDFIAMGESWLNRDLRMMEMETVVSGTTSGDLTLPADFAELRSLSVSSGGYSIELNQVTPQEYTRWTETTGLPSVFAIIDQKIKFGPIAAADTAYQLTYFAKIPALSDSNTTNWLLTKAPDVYLYVSLLQSAPYLKDDARIATWANAYKSGIDALTVADKNARYGSAPLRMRVQSQCP